MRYQFFSRLAINSMLILSAISSCKPIYAESSISLFGSSSQDTKKGNMDNEALSNNSERYSDDNSYNSTAYKILDEFKEYIRNTPERIQREISNYRAQLNSLNKQKKEYYNKLSIEAQEYLKKTYEFKTQLENQTRGCGIDSESQGSTWDAAKEKMKDTAQNMKGKMQEMKEKVEDKMRN